MSKYLINPKNTIFSSETAPAENYKLYFYETGTTNLKDTYSDGDLTSKNSNPVLLSSGGQADIWLENDGAYRVKLDTDADVNVWQYDNITGNTALFSNLITNSNNLDMNGYDIITSSANKNIPLAPNGTGLLNIKNLTFTTDVNLNGNNIIIDDTHGFKQDITLTPLVVFSETTSAVNYIDISNAASGNSVILAAEGDDTNIDLNVTPKGSGVTATSSNIGMSDGDIIYDNNGNELVAFGAVSSAVNYFTIDPVNDIGSDKNNCDIGAAGTDTNISINLLPKGTGVVSVIDETISAADDDDLITLDMIDRATSVFNITNMSASPSYSVRAYINATTGTPVVAQDVGITSVDDNGTGDYTINRSFTKILGVAYPIVQIQDTSGNAAVTGIGTDSASSIQILLGELTDGSAADQTFHILA